VLAERIRERRAVTPVKHNVRYVKFTPEEMAYDIPDDTSHFLPVGRGRDGLFAKPSKKVIEAWRKQLTANGAYARIDPDVRRVFPDDQMLNRALRKVMELQQLANENVKRKKSA